MKAEMSRTDGRKRAAKRALRNPTAMIRPGMFTGQGMLNYVLNGEPWFTWLDVPLMQRDPAVIFGLEVKYAPLSRIRVEKVAAPRDDMKRWIAKTTEAFWQRDLPMMIADFGTWGRMVGGVEWEWDCDTNRLELKQIKRVEPFTATPRVWNKGKHKNRFAGFQTSQWIEGTKDSFVSHPNAFWFAGRQRLGEFCDIPAISGSHTPWMEKNAPGGARASRRLLMWRDAVGLLVVQYPEGKSKQNGVMMNNEDAARQMGELVMNGAVVTMPSTPISKDRPEKGWSIDQRGGKSDPAGVKEYPKDLDGEIWAGMSIPEEVIRAMQSGSGFAGRSIPNEVHLGQNDTLAGMIFRTFKAQVLDFGVWVNFGHKRYEVGLTNLVEKFREEGKNPQGPTAPGDTSGGGGQPRAPGQPYTGPRGGRGVLGPDGKPRYGVELSGVPGAYRDAVRDRLGIRPSGAPEVPVSDQTYSINPLALERDPERFQFRRDVNDEGLRKRFKSIEPFDPYKAGAILVWRDPADGKDYVIDGHHRHWLALLSKAPEIFAKYVPAITAEQAREIGQLHNESKGAESVNLSDTPDGDDAANDGNTRRLAVLAMLDLQDRAHTEGDPNKYDDLIETIAELADDPEELAAVFGAVNLGWVEYGKSRSGKQRWRDDATGALRYQLTMPGTHTAKREEAKASAKTAHEIIKAARDGTATADHLRDLPTHIGKLTVVELRNARRAIAGTFKSGSRRDAMVNALISHVEKGPSSWVKKTPVKRSTKAATGESLAEVVRSYGGIDPNSHALRAHFGGMREATEYGFSIGMFKKGGRGLDELAEELHTSGHITVPEGTDPAQHLVNQIAKKAKSDLFDATNEIESAMDDYYRTLSEVTGEQHDYTPGELGDDWHTPETDRPEVVEAVRRGKEAGERETKWGLSQKGGGATDFNFGRNAGVSLCEVVQLSAVPEPEIVELTLAPTT